MIAYFLRLFFARDYTLQEQMDAVRAVIEDGEQPRVRVRFEKADARYQTG